MTGSHRLPTLLFLVVLFACGRVERSELRHESVGATQDSVHAGLVSSRRTAIVNSVEQVAPAVVSINVTARQQIAPRTGFDFMFVPRGAERRVRSFGTGLIVRPDGLVLTNQHVVAGAEAITVTLADGRDFAGTVLGEDPLTDIAVIRISAENLRVANIGQSTDLLIGEWVLALGNPYAYLLGNAEPTVTVGVISATGRNILPSDNQLGLYLDMIQTDAAINPGNSGGPLVNALGEVVGVNSSIFSNSGGSIGLGFAIPIERAMRVADEIVRTGAVRRAWVGMDVAGPAQMAERLSSAGIRVTSVVPNGPAARANIRVGDMLLRAGGRPLRNYLDWEAVKLDLHVGDDLTLETSRDGSRRSLRLTTGDLPTVTAAKVTVLRDLQAVTVSPAIRAERSIRSNGGALIYRISADVARATGLQSGDVIVLVNRSPVTAAEQFAEFLRSMPPGQPFRVTFERGSGFDHVDLAF